MESRPVPVPVDPLGVGEHGAAGKLVAPSGGVPADSSPRVRRTMIRNGSRTSRSTRVVGLDLGGSPKRDTGACLLLGPKRLRAKLLHSDREILDFVGRARPELVVIDAPLSLPRGRRTIEDRSGQHLRECDRELLRRRIPFFPLTLGPMRMLTVRGMRLQRILVRRGFPVIEGYPGGAQDILGLLRKKAGERVLEHRLRGVGLGGDLELRPLTHDELDAVTIAWVGRNFRNGDGVLIGDPTEGQMLLPRAPGARGRRQSHRRLPSLPRRERST